MINKLIYISNARIPTEKAHGIQIMKMCEAFAKQGVKVELIHPSRVQTKRMREVRDIWSYYNVENIFKLKTLPCLDLAIFFKFLPKSWEKMWFFTQSISYAVIAFLWLLFRKLTRDDIIYNRDQFSLSLIILFKRLIRAKVFFEAHKFPKGKRKTVSFLFKRLDGLIVITRKLKELYMREGIAEDKIFVAPDGVDLGMFNNSMSKEDARNELEVPLGIKMICYTGHLYDWKGTYILAMSMKYFSNGGVCYFVGGTEEDISKFKEHVRENEISNVVIVGHVSPKKVSRYLAASDVVILPNIKKGLSEYTSPLKLFEYMGSKRPIIASDLPSIGEILQNERNAILVEPGNPKALAEGIKRVLEDKELAGRISRQAFGDVQEYTWDKRAERIINFVR